MTAVLVIGADLASHYQSRVVVVVWISAAAAAVLGTQECAEKLDVQALHPSLRVGTLIWRGSCCWGMRTPASAQKCSSTESFPILH
jgi:hypothetical protein